MPGEVALSRKDVQEFMRLIAADLAASLIERNSIPRVIVQAKIDRLNEFAAFYRDIKEDVIMNLQDDEIHVLMRKSANELIASLDGWPRRDTKKQVDRLVVLQSTLAEYVPPKGDE